MSKAGQATPKQRREEYKDYHYCGPNYTFPAEDAEDIHNAVSRLNTTNSAVAPIKACLIRRASAIGASIPDTWKQGHANMGKAATRDPELVDIAQFAMEQRGTELINGVPHVVRYGKVFEAGDYPAQRLSMTPEDCLLAAMEFNPVPNDLEHMQTILDGHLGMLRKVELGEDGASLYGEVVVPEWLEATQAGKPIAVSLGIHRGEKLIKKNALVLDPQVKDAAVFSAYAAFSGKAGVQAIHDATVAHGAKCGGSDGDEAGMRMTHDDVMQRMHDMTVAHGANCMSNLSNVPFTVNPDGTVVIQGEQKPPVGDNGQRNQQPQQRQEAHVADTVDLAEFNRIKAELDNQKAENERNRKRVEDMERERIDDKAAQRANALVAQFKAFPANRDAVKNLYVQAYTDDGAGLATFNGTTISSRVAALDAMFENMPTFGLTEEQLKDTDLAQLRQAMVTRKAGEEVKPSRERIDALLKMDPLGKEIVAERTKNGN